MILEIVAEDSLYHVLEISTGETWRASCENHQVDLCRKWIISIAAEDDKNSQEYLIR